MGEPRKNEAEEETRPERAEEVHEITLLKLREELDWSSKATASRVKKHLDNLTDKVGLLEDRVSETLAELAYIRDIIEDLTEEGKLVKTLENTFEKASRVLATVQSISENVSTILAYSSHLSVRMDILIRRVEELEAAINRIYERLFTEAPPKESPTQ